MKLTAKKTIRMTLARRIKFFLSWFPKFLSAHALTSKSQKTTERRGLGLKMRRKRLLVLLVMAVFLMAVYSVGGVATAAPGGTSQMSISASQTGQAGAGVANDDEAGAEEDADQDEDNNDGEVQDEGRYTGQDGGKVENKDENQDEGIDEDQEAAKDADEDLDLDEEEDAEKKAEKIQEAQEDLAKALAKLAEDPGDKNAYEDLARAYAALDQWDQAKEAATQLLAIDPDNEEASILLAVSLYRQGDQEGAMQHLQAMASQKSDDDDVYELLGELLELQGELDEALEQYEQAAALNPNDPDIFVKLSKTYQKLEIEGVKVFVNGSKPQFGDVQPQIADGRTLIPFRALAESLGAQVSWDGATRQVIVVKADITMRLTADSTVATINGTPVNLDVPATITGGGRILVPLRFLGEGLGAKVKWDQQSQMVIVSQ
ncbi:MAG: tetratricopeptide repeat protein [Clostridia bacterium]|nr:MAG: tetratricopeptide repeat protein [Clostridia bacterium]